MRMCVLDCWTVVLHLHVISRIPIRMTPSMKAATASPVLLPTLFSSSPIIIISSRLAVFLLLLLMTFSPFAYAKRILLQTTRPTAFVGIAPVCKQRRFYNNNSCLHCHLQLQLSIPTAQDMEDLGAILSMDTSAGDVLCLQGDLGAGKTCLSRGFIQTRTHNNDNDKVTSPTYLLTNTYPTHDGIMQVYIKMLGRKISTHTSHSFILIVFIALELQNTSHGSLSTFGKGRPPRLGTTRFGQCLYQWCVRVASYRVSCPL